MVVFFTDRFNLPLPEGHRFPMRKYSRLRERVVAAGVLGNDQLREPPPAGDPELLLAHCPNYLQRVVEGGLTPAEIRRLGFPWSSAMVERSRRSVGATLAAARSALVTGWGINLAGGTHHAFRDRGEGYCVFNDTAVAARVLQAEKRVRRVLVIDCDVHQGNGTAALFAGDPTVFTFSIHGARNYPLKKETSDLDIALEDGADDRTYLDALETGLRAAFEAASADLVLYLAGADPWFGDRLGRMGLTKQGLAVRDDIVFDFCRAKGLPVAISMAGGYAPNVEDIVDIHLQTVLEGVRRSR